MALLLDACALPICVHSLQSESRLAAVQASPPPVHHRPSSPPPHASNRRIAGCTDLTDPTVHTSPPIHNIRNSTQTHSSSCLYMRLTASSMQAQPPATNPHHTGMQRCRIGDCISDESQIRQHRPRCVRGLTGWQCGGALSGRNFPLKMTVRTARKRASITRVCAPPTCTTPKRAPRHASSSLAPVPYVGVEL